MKCSMVKIRGGVGIIFRSRCETMQAWEQRGAVSLPDLHHPTLQTGGASVPLSWCPWCGSRIDKPKPKRRSSRGASSAFVPSFGYKRL